MLSILDLQSVLEGETSDTVADVDCWECLNYNNTDTYSSSSSSSSSSLALMNNVSMTQPIDSSAAAAVLAPHGKQRWAIN